MRAVESAYEAFGQGDLDATETRVMRTSVQVDGERPAGLDLNQCSTCKVADMNAQTTHRPHPSTSPGARPTRVGQRTGRARLIDRSPRAARTHHRFLA